VPRHPNLVFFWFFFNKWKNHCIKKNHEVQEEHPSHTRLANGEIRAKKQKEQMPQKAKKQEKQEN